MRGGVSVNTLMLLIKLLLNHFFGLFYNVLYVKKYLYECGVFKQLKLPVKMIGIGHLSFQPSTDIPFIQLVKGLFQSTEQIGVIINRYKILNWELLAIKNDDYVLGKSYIHDNLWPFTIITSSSIRTVINKILNFNPLKTLLIVNDLCFGENVKPSVYILLTDYNKLFYNDYLFPIGTLIYQRQVATNTGIVVVTNCPTSLHYTEQSMIKNEIVKYFPKSEVFFCKVTYQLPISIDLYHLPVSHYKYVILFASTNDINELKSYVNSNFVLIKSFIFDVNHCYQISDFNEIVDIFISRGDGLTCIFTTQFDIAKLHNPSLKIVLDSFPIFYVPNQIQFINSNEQLFLKAIQTLL